MGDIGNSKMWPVTEQEKVSLIKDRAEQWWVKDREVQLKWSKWEGKNVKGKGKLELPFHTVGQIARIQN